MKKTVFLASLLAIGCGGSEKSVETPVPQENMEQQAVTPPPSTPANPAPSFTLPDQNGKNVSLSDYSGKVVVLEWFNPGCPFVKYAYGEKGPLRKMAKDYEGKGVVWLRVNSGAAGKQGASMADNKKAAKDWGINSILIDSSGQTGQAYGAKTTPHIWVIDQQGNIAYKGALDNAPMGEAQGGTYTNYVGQAIDAVLAGQPVTQNETTSYGCSVKYGS